MSARKWRLLFATPPLCHAIVGLPIADLALHCRIQTQLPRGTSLGLGVLLHAHGLDRLDLGLLHFCGGEMARCVHLLRAIGYADCPYSSRLHTQSKNFQFSHSILENYFIFTQCYLLTTTSASAAYKSELNLQGQGPHYSGSSSNDLHTTSSRLSHMEATEASNMENAEDINNSLAAIGSIASRVQQGGVQGQYESSLKGTI